MTTHIVSPIDFDGREIEITGHAYHHLFRVRRLRVGEEMRIVDGEGRARRGVVARVDRSHAVIALGSSEPALESGFGVELLVAPPKPDRAAWLVEKATEVGVRAVRFVMTERTARDERSFGPAQILRLLRIAQAAVEQCGRAVVPEVSGPHGLEEKLGELEANGVAAVVLGAAGEPAMALLSEVAGERDALSLVVGPEGGWSATERERFAAAGLREASLGERVLRVETAAVAGAALALALARSRRAGVSGSVDTPRHEP